MTTFYDHGTVRITERSLFIDERRYDIDQLLDLRTARGPVDRFSCSLALAAGVMLLFAVVTAQHLPLPATATIVTTGVVPLAVTAAIRARLWPSMYLLWADYHGMPVRLFQSRDETEFGKVTRALIRARTYQQRGVKYVVLGPDA